MKRQISVIDGLAYVPLTKGRIAIVDVRDIDIVYGYNWFVKEDKHCAYAMRKARIDGRRVTLLMHREIAAPPDDMEVDHLDGDGLNNRRDNMRVVTHAENTRNTKPRDDSKSGIKGVYWSARECKWIAQITHNGVQHYLGIYGALEDAVAARHKAELEFRSPFEKLIASMPTLANAAGIAQRRP